MLQNANFPNVLKAIHSMENAGLCQVGEHLGYQWNAVCDAVQCEGFYAEDGDGAFTINREADNQYCNNATLNHIMVAIFEQHPDVETIQIVN